MADLAASFLTGKQEEKAAIKAANIQANSAEQGISETQRQFDAMKQGLDPYASIGMPAIQGLQPYMQAGQGAIGGLSSFANVGQQALQGQQNLSGLGGVDAQNQAIQQIENGPLFGAMARQGENAMLQNASATGGLRGGNMQAALATFRPDLLNQMINQQYAQYGGLAAQGGNVGQFLASSGQNLGQNMAQLGQASAAGTGAAGMSAASQVAGLYGDQGAALAGGAMARARPWQQANAAHQSTLSDAGSFMSNMYTGRR